MSIVIFSKDRPFQLSECLRSLIKYEVNGCKSQDVYVLVKLTETERERYERVEKSFPSVRFVKEGESFEKDLQGILKECSNAKTIMFTVDDAFFYRNFSLSECANLLERRKDVYSVHLKLSSRIDYCHPAQKNVKVPTLHKDSTFMIFDRSEGTMDWNYPWDLAGSVYRTWCSQLHHSNHKKITPTSTHSNTNRYIRRSQNVSRVELDVRHVGM